MFASAALIFGALLSCGNTRKDSGSSSEPEPDVEARAIGRSNHFSSHHQVAAALQFPGPGVGVAPDVDGDEDPDLIYTTAGPGQTLAWFENDGDTNADRFSEAKSIGVPAQGWLDIHTADFDADGDVDFLVTSIDRSEVAWFENRDGLGDFGEAHRISFELPDLKVVTIRDLDGDSDLDFVLRITRDGEDRLFWFENTDDETRFAAGIELGTVWNHSPSFIVDLYGDGDLRLIEQSSSRDFVSRSITGTSPVLGEPVELDMPCSNATSAMDVDGDGDVDFVSELSDGLAYCKNMGAASGFVRRYAPGEFRPLNNLVAADLNASSTLEVIGLGNDLRLVTANDDTGDFGRASNFETPLGAQFVLANVDGDDDVDVVAYNSGQRSIEWIENTGGHLRFETYDVTEGVNEYNHRVPDGGQAALLAIDATHLGHAGDPAVELADIVLFFDQIDYFDDENGEFQEVYRPLTQEEVASVAAHIHIYRDDGSHYFEPFNDRKVSTLSEFVFDEHGVLHVPIEKGSPGASVEFQGVARFFVVVELREDATASHDYFAMHHLTGLFADVASQVRHADTGEPLDAELGRDDWDEYSTLNSVYPSHDADGDGLADFDDLHDDNFDFDGDGLSDGDEFHFYRTDPNVDADSDRDGLTDAAEILVHGTNAWSNDTDRDGITDGDELALFESDPLDPDANDDGVLDGDADTDGDGLSDAAELNQFRSNPFVPSISRSVLLRNSCEGNGIYFPPDGGNHGGPPPYSTDVIDFSRDGTLDVVTLSEESGSPLTLIRRFYNDSGQGEFRPSDEIRRGEVVGNRLRRGTVSVGDINGDGDVDVLTSSLRDGGLGWYEKVDPVAYLSSGDTEPREFTARYVGGIASDAYAVLLVDIDSDRTLDACVAGPWGLACYVNVEGKGNFVSGPTVPALDRPIDALASVDMDSDGDWDLVASSRGHDETLGQINVFENQREEGKFGAPRMVFEGNVTSTPIQSLDADGDGDLDMVFEVRRYEDDRLRMTRHWLENRDGRGDYGAPHEIASHSIDYTERDDSGFDVVDIDADGDLDLIHSHGIDLYQSVTAWSENLDTPGDGFASPVPLSNSFSNCGYTAHPDLDADDLDDDGFADIIVTTMAGVGWTKNRGGHFRFETNDLGIAGVFAGELAPIFAIDAYNHGHDGDPALTFDGFSFELFEIAYMSAFNLYVDDGSGDFDPALDSLLISVPEEELKRDLFVALPDGPAILTVPVASDPIRFFAVVATKSDVSGAPYIRVSHRTDSETGRTTAAVNAAGDEALVLEFSPNTVSHGVQVRSPLN